MLRSATAGPTTTSTIHKYNKKHYNKRPETSKSLQIPLLHLQTGQQRWTSQISGQGVQGDVAAGATATVPQRTLISSLGQGSRIPVGRVPLLEDLIVMVNIQITDIIVGAFLLEFVIDTLKGKACKLSRKFKKGNAMEGI